MKPDTRMVRAAPADLPAPDKLSGLMAGVALAGLAIAIAIVGALGPATWAAAAKTTTALRGE
jgi:hypothetical protein